MIYYIVVGYFIVVIFTLALCSANRLWEDEEPIEPIVYISGPITNTKDAKERFRKAEDDLKKRGYKKVINPERLCEVYKYDAMYGQYMAHCKLMVKNSRVIYMLKGWENSKGAITERTLAMSQNMEVIYEY